MNLIEQWSHLLPAEPTACAFAGEDILVGTADGLLLRLGPAGKVRSELPLPPPILDISPSRDGCFIGIACGNGEAALLETDRVLFLHAPGCYAGQVRLGPDAEYLLVMSPRGEGVFLNRYGREMRRLQVPDGARSVALVPKTGEVLTLNRAGEIHANSAWGKPLWQIEVGPHAKAIRSNDSGDLVLLPALSFGVTALASNGGSIGTYDVGEPVTNAFCDSAGETLLFTTLRNRLVVMKRDATVLASETLPTGIEHSTISPDGTNFAVTTESGYIHRFALVDGEPSGPAPDSVTPAHSDRRLIFSERLFSAFMIAMPPRVGFSRAEELVVIAGGGGPDNGL